MDTYTISSLIALCSAISSRAISSTDDAQNILQALTDDDNSAQGVRLAFTTLRQLERNATKLETALNLTTATLERSRQILSRSLTSCELVVASLQEHIMRPELGELQKLNSTFMIEQSGFLMTYNHLISWMTDVLNDHQSSEQDELDSPIGKDIVNQADIVTRMVEKPHVDAPAYEAPKTSGAYPSSSLEQVASDSKGTPEDPPPYTASIPAANFDAPPTSPSSATVLASSKGGFFKALTTSLRRKPDPLVSALCQAVTLGDEKQASGLIGQGANVNGRNEAGNTPLKCAILTDQASTARRILEAGGSSIHASCADLPPLFLACSVGSLNVAKVLLDSGASIDSKFVSSEPHFVGVVRKGNFPGVQFLLEHGADANAKAITGQPIIVQELLNGSVEIVKLLLEYGADINSKDVLGNPLAAVAVENGNAKMLEMLLDQGARQDACNYLGSTLLAASIAKRRVDIAKQLLKRGASAAQTGSAAQPVLIDIIMSPILKVDEKIDLMNLLLTNGADPDITDHLYGLPAICHAVSLPNPAVTEELLKHGASTQVRMLGGQTLLTYAIDLHRCEHVKLLLNYGADVDEVDGLKRTPLTLVLLYLNYNLAKLLFDYGVDVHAEDNKEAIKRIKTLRRQDLMILLGVKE